MNPLPPQRTLKGTGGSKDTSIRPTHPQIPTEKKRLPIQDPFDINADTASCNSIYRHHVPTRKPKTTPITDIASP